MPECGQKEGYFILHQAFEMDGEIFPIKIQMNSPLLPDVFTKLLFETLTALDDNALKRLSHHQPPQQQQRQKPKSLDQDADERRQSCQVAAIDSIGHVLHGTEWEQRKNDLIMYLAHDLKTPLSSVIGYLTLLRDESQISKELREKYLSITLGKAERLEDLINEFFEITRFNIYDITLQYTKINLTRLLEQLVYEFKPMLKSKNLQCNLCVDDDIMLRCDADKIQRVFDNLLRNAVIYSFENTDITISAQCHEDTVSIIFCNHGDTLPEEKLNRIFEQFYRLDAARSTSSGGAGLGLAIAKQIVELHNGTIVAESQEDQNKFSITLPLA